MTWISPLDDDSAKSSSTALRFTLRHCGVSKSTPHSSGFACLVYEAFFEIVLISDFRVDTTKACLHMTKHGFSEKPLGLVEALEQFAL